MISSRLMNHQSSHTGPKVTLWGIDIQYNHPHDMAAIIETHVLNVYHTELLKRGDTVLDLGAGIGEFALLASMKVGPKGKVIAIEPSPDDYETLLANIETNGCSNISPKNVAVANFMGELQLEFKGRTFRSACKPLRNILKEEKVERVDFCKMDIEGGERQVIPENVDTFSEVQHLSMEIHSGYQDELIPLMQRLGFNFNRVTRTSYIESALKFALRNPIEACVLMRLLKRAGEYPGVRKIVEGIDIERSSDLVVGTFSKQGVINNCECLGGVGPHHETAHRTRRRERDPRPPG